MYANLLLFEEQKDQIESILRWAKAHYEDRLVNRIQENPKLFWNYTRHFTHSSSTIDMLVHEGKQITEDPLKAEILNKTFISVLTDEPPLEFMPERPKVDNVLLDFVFTPEAVREKLVKLKMNKASGPDGVNVNVLRNCK